MKMRWVLVVLAALVLSALVATAETVQGTITKIEWGKFMLKDKTGTTRVLAISKKATTFEPMTWRPSVGEEVSVDYEQITTRSGAGVLQNLSCKLVTPTKQSIVDLQSPIEVDIIETGRSGVRARLPNGRIIKFTSSRQTQWEPAGWAPGIGAKARIEFVTEASGATFSVNYTMTRIEKIQ